MLGVMSPLAGVARVDVIYMWPNSQHGVDFDAPFRRLPATKASSAILPYTLSRSLLAMKRNGTAGTGGSYLINTIWQLLTDRAAASALKVTVPAGMQVAAANIHHGPRCGSVADIQSIQRDSK